MSTILYQKVLLKVMLLSYFYRDIMSVGVLVTWQVSCVKFSKHKDLKERKKVCQGGIRDLNLFYLYLTSIHRALSIPDLYIYTILYPYSYP